MSDKELLRKLGVFISENFLDSGFCAEVRSEVDAAITEPVTVYAETGNEGIIQKLDIDYRSTLGVKAKKEVMRQVRDRLFSIKSTLEEHFAVELSNFEGPSCLRYREGDFFKLHRDMYPNHPTSNRKVSIVIFLNSQSGTLEANSYCGGSLNLFGLIGGQTGRKYGISCKGEEGMLVAFPSDVLHEVASVTAGSRLSIVGWFN